MKAPITVARFVTYSQCIHLVLPIFAKAFGQTNQKIMYSKFWLVIRDDSTRTFEVCGQDGDGNYFTNGIHGMQKAGMTVTGMTPPVGTKFSNKESIKVIGYAKEEGLYDRLRKEYNEISRKLYDQGEE